VATNIAAPAGPDFEAAGPDFAAARPAGPDFEAAGPEFLRCERQAWGHESPGLPLALGPTGHSSGPNGPPRGD